MAPRGVTQVGASGPRVMMITFYQSPARLRLTAVRAGRERDRTCGSGASGATVSLSASASGAPGAVRGVRGAARPPPALGVCAPPAPSPLHSEGLTARAAPPGRLTGVGNATPTPDPRRRGPGAAAPRSTRHPGTGTPTASTAARRHRGRRTGLAGLSRRHLAEGRGCHPPRPQPRVPAAPESGSPVAAAGPGA